MRLSAVFLIICFACPIHVRSAFFPAALPLAVRSPYLQCYANTRAGMNVNNQWFQFWTESRILGWTGWIRIDGSTFELWGASPIGKRTNLTSFEITPTRTILSIQANTMNVNVTFLSPIEPSNLVLQSLPFSYVYIDVESNDGQEHSVQLYSDISAEWISGDSNSVTSWSMETGNSSRSHKASRSSPLSMQENESLAEDATVYYAFPFNDDTSYGADNDTVLRTHFKTNGNLPYDVSTQPRVIRDHWVVFGHAINLHNITSTPSSIVWAIGLVRDPVINIDTTNNRSPYFLTTYNTVKEAIDFFLSDFSEAKQRAIALDNSTISNASQISDDYADLVGLAARQALAVDITVSKDHDNRWNMSDVMTFMKGVGDSGRVNPVEILYASFPAYLYFNATWAGYLLEPLLRYQQPSQYAAQDLGSSYPKVSGNNGQTPARAVEGEPCHLFKLSNSTDGTDPTDSGSMLIMGWAHARFSGDHSMISRYYNTYKNWADFLVSVGLNQDGYKDADLEQAFANTTNVAIKGIIGIKAMSEISQALGKSKDAENYSSIAESYVERWQTLAVSNGRLLSSYGVISDSDQSSWSLIYNLYADKLLNTTLVDSNIYINQDDFYFRQVDASGVYGIQYDSRAPERLAKSHWTLFAAGASDNATLRDSLISRVHTKAGSNFSAGVFPLTYDPDNGTTTSGWASPGQGAMFSLMALGLQPKAVSDVRDGPHGQASKAGAIAGGIVGGLAALTLLVFSFFMYRRWRRRKQDTHRLAWSSTSDSPCFPPQSSDLYGSNELQPLRLGQSHSQTGRRSGKRTQPTVSSNPTSGPTAVASTTANESFRGNQREGSDSNNNPNIDTSVQLRSEMENLRREVDEMRARVVYESPPEYDA
ncbi:hypothetical protein EDD18DRAFT_1386124 [Armillaria luteobubalina]|uniref:DUF1793-domain-containing protein n=1 Tax=Armillaria luteobubalina TaxID=153913 RepID=A0AA39Q5Z6_9AGAR|nr:hypothetical protein EDD18DRAFT_1386124 [Armillaria luteobubalina]